MPGTLFVVATPIGNLEDITLRALRVLREAVLIAAEDTRRTAHLLARHAISTPTTSLHEHNEVRKSAAIITRLLAGDDIALVSDAGTPGVSDPGAHLVRAAREAGVRVEPVPGPSAVMAALSVSGLSTNEFFFAGFPPTRSKDRASWMARVANADVPVVMFEAPHRIRDTMAELERVLGPERRVLLGRELTKKHEEFVERPIRDVMNLLHSDRGEFVVVLDVGHKPEISPPCAPEPSWLAQEIGLLTESGHYSKRAAVASVARKYGLGTNAVYKALETAKISGE